MTLRCLVDECASYSVARYLEGLGYDVASVRLIMPKADDGEVLEFAANTDRVLVTADKGFGVRVFRHAAAHAGILLLRPPNNSTYEKVRMATQALPQYADHLPGNYVVSTDNGVRIVRLPPRLSDPA